MRMFLFALAPVVAGCIGDSEQLFWNGDAAELVHTPARPVAQRMAPPQNQQPTSTVHPTLPGAPPEEPPHMTGPAVVSAGGSPSALSCDELGAYWVDNASGNAMRLLADEAPVAIAHMHAGVAIDSAPVGALLYVATSDRIVRVDMRTGSADEYAETPGLRALRFLGGVYWSDDRGLNGPTGRVLGTDGAPAFSLDQSGLYAVDPADHMLRHYMFDGVEQTIVAEAHAINGPSGIAISWPRAFWANEDGLHFAAEDGDAGVVAGPSAFVSLDGGILFHADAFGAGSKIAALNHVTMAESGIWSGARITSIAACAGRLYWTTISGDVWFTEPDQ